MAYFSRLAFVILAVSSLAGCATSTDIKNVFDEPAAGSDLQGLIHEIHLQLNRQTCPIEETNREARLLRAHLLVAMIARYGAARIEDYSAADPASDAAKVLARVQSSEIKLAEALQTLNASADSPTPAGGTNVFYRTEQVDLLIEIIELAAAAGGPTLREMGRVALSTSPIERINRGKKLLLNALEDKLYKDAYSDGCQQLFDRVSKRPNASPIAIDWADISVHLNRSCMRLNRLAQTQIQCVAAGIPGPAPKPKP